MTRIGEGVWQARADGFSCDHDIRRYVRLVFVLGGRRKLKEIPRAARILNDPHVKRPENRLTMLEAAAAAHLDEAA